jgi:chemotaxis protein CheC
LTDLELDRLSELTNIGAGHAATAFSRLAGRTMWMRVPRVRVPGELSSAHREEEAGTGVFFEFSGCLGAVVGILFSALECQSLVRMMVGSGVDPDSDESVQSALMELGNILASHVASAIADTLGDRLLPSLPILAMHGAGEELYALAAERTGRDPIRIECELTDGTGQLGGLLVLIPVEEIA